MPFLSSASEIFHRHIDKVILKSLWKNKGTRIAEAIRKNKKKAEEPFLFVLSII